MRAQNLISDHDRGASGSSQGNAMILPVPAREHFTSENIINTEGCPNFLTDIGTAAKLYSESFIQRASGAMRGTLGGSLEFEMFRSGIYQIVIAKDSSFFERALLDVDEDKRPELNREILSAYSSRWYQDWFMTLWCFSTRDAVDATPALMLYEPLDPTRLFLPGLDCHTGEVPDLSAYVERDHTLAVSCLEMQGGNSVHYTEISIPGAVKRLLPDRVMGFLLPEGSITPNCDFWYDISAMRSPDLVLPSMIVPS
ncbi:MAG TPA: hypothetical protein VJA22_01190, partial [Patescibacteria group bacterium]|nr:hypothetical protein [Patescibacteria group bacterium]